MFKVQSCNVKLRYERNKEKMNLGNYVRCGQRVFNVFGFSIVKFEFLLVDIYLIFLGYYRK